ncbi:hypothetical protein WA026_011718 [Henosepilachna vigintioctopunctata]|uniref:RanBP2-type domain-containing protein n=1 Tax=Henosepilachna vigintioctopunctata TaxID=420089 RepID=A0AAW1UBS9_9CUCU
MVIMDNYYLQDRLPELWTLIDKLHMQYLAFEESPEKIEKRSELEDVIREYLCMASHDQKFSLPVTYDVLFRSAHAKPDFSAYKALTGFNALQLYAGNLVSQPWRKEYKQIRKYSGFFKHHVESNLVNAELFLEAMGYRPVGLSTLILDGPIGPDKVISVSKDCLIAYVECQIMKTIWEEMANSNMNMSWLEILNFRQNHLCSPEQSIKSLKYQYQQKHFQQQVHMASQGNLSLHRAPSGFSNNSFSPPTAHESMSSSLLPPYLYGSSTCCQSTCQTYAQMQSPHPSAMSYSSHIMKPQFNSNGYYYSNGLPSQATNYNSTIPIAQLIEVESQNGYDVTDRPSNSRRPQMNTEMYANYNEEDLMTQENRVSDKNDTPFENWDYVYKTLKTQGYNKDLGERGDVLSLGIESKTKQDYKNTEKKKKDKDLKKTKVSNLETSINTLTITNKTKTNSSDKVIKPKKSLDTKSQIEVSPASSYDNLISGDKKQSVKTTHLTLPKAKTSNLDKGAFSKQTSKMTKKEEKNKLKSECHSWQCKVCTYLNSNSNNICEMCSKSKSNVEDEVEVGGPECEQCTLVNPKDAKKCQACNQSLENSPTRV